MFVGVEEMTKLWARSGKWKISKLNINAIFKLQTLQRFQTKQENLEHVFFLIHPHQKKHIAINKQHPENHQQPPPSCLCSRKIGQETLENNLINKLLLISINNQRSSCPPKKKVGIPMFSSFTTFFNKILVGWVVIPLIFPKLPEGSLGNP